MRMPPADNKSTDAESAATLEQLRRSLFYQGGRLVEPTRVVDASSSKPTWTFSVSYDLTEDVMAYLRYATGYRSRGVNLRDPTFRSFEPDETINYEAGFKSAWLNRRLQLNATVFSMDWKKMQLDFASPANTSITTTINAGKADLDGLELEVTAIPLTGLTVSLAYAYTDSKLPPQPNAFNNNVLDRFYLPQTPKHAGALSLDYEFAPQPWGSLSLHVDASRRSHYATTAGEPPFSTAKDWPWGWIAMIGEFRRNSRQNLA